MRIKSFAGFLLAIGLVWIGCGSEEVPQVSPKDALLIFVDKTISSTPNEARQEAFTDQTVQTVKNTLQGPGDIVQGNFIQGNTVGSTAFLRSDPVPAFEPPTKGGGKSQKDAEIKHKKTILELQGVCNKKLRAAIKESNPTKTSLYTDLWGILEVATRAFKQEAYDTKTIHILSDMQESMEGPGRRDFHKNPIQSKSEAIAFAKSDAQTLQQLLDVDPAVLAGTRVVIFPPFDALEASDFALNRYYWEALFKAFGISDVQVK
jgi:hypothetical protein